MRKLTLVLLVLCVASLSGCARRASTPSDSPLYSRTPEEVLQRVFDFCREGKYHEAARLYVNGPQMMNSTPATVKETVDRACTSYGKTAVHFEIAERQERGEGALYRIFLSQYPKGDPRTQSELWYRDFTFIKKPQGWLIAQST